MDVIRKQASAESATEALSAIFGKLMSYVTEDWINVEIGTAQIKVVFVLHFGGRLHVNQLAEHLGIGAPTASHHVEKLVQAGYATRIESAVDRRSVEVDLTPKGHAIAERLSGVTHKGLITHWISQMERAQIATLQSSLNALLAIIQNETPERNDK